MTLFLTSFWQDLMCSFIRIGNVGLDKHFCFCEITKEIDLITDLNTKREFVRSFGVNIAEKKCVFHAGGVIK